MLIKICGITTEADALLAVGMGADAIGFVFAPSPRQVSVATVAGICRRVPADVLTVGVFRDEAPSRVVELVNQAGLRAAQLHGHESAADTSWVAARVATTIKAFPAGDRAIGRFGQFGARYLLVDGTSPGSGQVFDWRLAEGVIDPGRLIVSGGLRPDNVGQAVAHLRPFGVDVSSGVEVEPGRKDPAALQRFVAAARAAEAALAAGAGADQVLSTGAAGAGSDQELGPYDWMDE